MEFSFDPSDFIQAMRKVEAATFLDVGNDMDMFYMLDELLWSNKIVTQDFGDIE